MKKGVRVLLIILAIVFVLFICSVILAYIVNNRASELWSVLMSLLGVGFILVFCIALGIAVIYFIFFFIKIWIVDVQPKKNARVRVLKLEIYGNGFDYSRSLQVKVLEVKTPYPFPFHDDPNAKCYATFEFLDGSEKEFLVSGNSDFKGILQENQTGILTYKELRNRENSKKLYDRWFVNFEVDS